MRSYPQEEAVNYRMFLNYYIKGRVTISSPYGVTISSPLWDDHFIPDNFLIHKVYQQVSVRGRSVVLDLHDPSDQSALPGSADVMVYGTDNRARPRRRDASRYQRLVRCAITGYRPGTPTPRAPRLRYLLVQARGGLMDIQAGWRPGPYHFISLPVKGIYPLS
jgi:hypothetical protein